MTGPAALACPRCGHPVPAHEVIARRVRAHPESSLRDVQRFLRDEYLIAGPAARRAVRSLLRLGVLRSVGPRGGGYRLVVNERGGAW